MRVNCVYRWALDAVISQSTYDTDNGVVQNLDADVFRLPAEEFKYHEGNYSTYGPVHVEILHKYLVEDKNAYAAIDFDGIGVLMVYHDYVVRRLFIGEVMRWELPHPVFTAHTLVNIGRAKTIVRQLSAMVSPQMLYYDTEDKVVHLWDSDMPLGFPIEELEMVTSYNRYVDMVEDPQAVGIVCSGGYNKLLIKDLKTGVLRKE